MSDQQQKNAYEEIELGSLFVIIGKGFSKLFKVIENIFKGVFDFFIQILLFIKQNLLKIGVTALIGGVIGFIIETQKEQKFGADMQVQPNFKSSRQLYNNINYYNDLVKQKDTTLLAKTFNISNIEAASLRGFSAEPVRTENDVLTSYDELILSVDTLTVKSYSYNRFKVMFTDYDYRIHKINVEATKNNVFSKLGNVIISNITKNAYFNKFKELTNEDLNRSDSILRNNLKQIDSLRKVYMQAILDDAKKESSGTNIDLGNSNKSVKELDLFETNRRLNKDLTKIAKAKSEKSEVVNIISNFQPVGYKIAGIKKNYAFLFAAAAAALMIFFLLLLKLNKFLENYNK